MSTATNDGTGVVATYLLEDLFARDLLCVIEDCEAVATWSFTWSCGHQWVYCTEHRNVFMQGIQEGRRVICSVCCAVVTLHRAVLL